MLRKWLARKRGQIYRYHNGKRKQYVDPLELWYQLFDDTNFDLRGNLVDLFAEETPEKIRNDAYFSVTDFAYKKMNIAPLSPKNGKGFTREQALETLLSFVDWVGELKKKRDACRPGLQPTDYPKNCPRGNGPDCTSTCRELKCLEQT